MCAALLTGCGSTGTSSTASTQAADAIHKIGVIFYGKDDDLGQCVYAEINHAAEVIGVEVEWALGDYDTESQLTSVENLISAGCEGIMFMPIEDASAQKVGQACEESGVYFAICFRDILDADIKSYVESCEYYVGSCWEDDKGAAEELVAVLAEDGRSVFGLEKLNPSIALAVRNTGFENGAEAVGAEIVAEYEVPNDGNSQTHINGITNFLNLYPDMDGILMTTSSQGAAESIVNTVKQNTAVGDVKLVMFDLYDGIAEDFEEGWVAAASAGNSPDALFVFLMLFNSVDGTPLSEDFINLSQKQVIITSAEECEDYEKYIDNPDYQIYSDEIIKSLVGKYNPDVTLEDYTELMDAFSLEWVKENAN
ncbi:MAG: sugar ABC transporter substrate-binding protein [Ruthenibacterium sp.]|nr:substrate-binding domain-containing protein [Oscillospiraceae bacterium]